jgi:hypothetical protein
MTMTTIIMIADKIEYCCVLQREKCWTCTHTHTHTHTHGEGVTTASIPRWCIVPLYQLMSNWNINIFRLCGDLLHLASFVILFLKILSLRSCAGKRKKFKWINIKSLTLQHILSFVFYGPPNSILLMGLTQKRTKESHWKHSISMQLFLFVVIWTCFGIGYLSIWLLWN